MSETKDKTFEEMLAGTVETAKKFKDEHGSCEIVVGPGNSIAAAGIERLAGIPVVRDHITLMSTKGEPDMKIEGDLVYFRVVENDGVSIKEAVRSIGWLDGHNEIEWHSADFGEDGSVYLEGDKGDVKMTMRMVVAEFTSFTEPDWDQDDDAWDEPEDDEEDESDG